jgi:hypothetical protein
MLSVTAVASVAVFKLQPAELQILSLASAQVRRICVFCALERGEALGRGRKRHCSESAACGPWQCRHREGQS